MVISYDTATRQVWVDPLDQRGEGQLLCEQHRSRLTPPRGWHVVDRRVPVEEPVTVVAPVAEPIPVSTPEPEVVTPVPPARRRRRSWGQIDLPRLEFTGPAIEVRGAVVEEPPGAEPPVEEPPGAEPPVEETPVEEPAAEEPPVAEPPEDEPPAGQAPVDDLGELLSPKGGLLGRAFRATGPQRSVLTEVNPES